MSFIHLTAKEVNCKVIYIGPGMSGKTTNMQYIYEKTNNTQLVSLSAENERTLFFDFLPLGIGERNGLKTRLHLYTLPGQSFYDTSRQFILRGLDGLIFVADSSQERMEANIETLNQLEKTLENQGYDIHSIPLVFQYNKRDIPQKLSIAELNATLNPMDRPYFEAIAHKGIGVMETLNACSQLVLAELAHEVKGRT